MARFSEHFDTNRDRIERLCALTATVRSIDEIARTAESRGGLEAEDAASPLLLGRGPSARAEIHRAARELRTRLAGNSVEFVVPEYLTSFCQNDCLYCGY